MQNVSLWDIWMWARLPALRSVLWWWRTAWGGHQLSCSTENSFSCSLAPVWWVVIALWTIYAVQVLRKGFSRGTAQGAALPGWSGFPIGRILWEDLLGAADTLSLCLSLTFPALGSKSPFLTSSCLHAGYPFSSAASILYTSGSKISNTFPWLAASVNNQGTVSFAVGLIW